MPRLIDGIRSIFSCNLTDFPANYIDPDVLNMGFVAVMRRCGRKNKGFEVEESLREAVNYNWRAR